VNMTNREIPDIITQVEQPTNKTAPPLSVQSPTYSANNRRYFGFGLINRFICCFSPQTSANLNPIPIGSPNALLPPPTADTCKKICLLLDLDETLVHSSFARIENPSFEIPLSIENQNFTVYVLKRPGVDEFITEMSKYFELVVFTASVPKYADPVLDVLDPERLIKHRLYREHCSMAIGGYVKDLSRIGRKLNRTLIIDNSFPAFRLQPNHGILIESFFDNPEDTELNKLIPFLVKLAECSDVRPMLAQWKKSEGNFT